jgi:hypothetical protein
MHVAPQADSRATSSGAQDAGPASAKPVSSQRAASPGQRATGLFTAPASARDDALGRILARSVLARQAAPAAPAVVVFQMDPATGKAVQISEATARSALNLTPRAFSRAAGTATVVIMRNGFLSRSSQATVDQINNPATAPAVIRTGLEKLQADTARLHGAFPADYYVEFARAVTEATLSQRRSDPDGAIDEVGNAYGTKEFPRGQAVLHLYEALVATNDNTHFDKVQHFLRSMKMQYDGTGITTDIAQYAKEASDEIQSWAPSVFGQHTGFDWNDMLANNRGQAYGQQLTRRFHPVRDLVYSPSTIPARVMEAGGQAMQEVEREIYRAYGVQGYRPGH